MYTPLSMQRDIWIGIAGDSVSEVCSSCSIYNTTTNEPTWPEVHRWVREPPDFDRVKLARRAIGTVACLVRRFNTQYLCPRMKRIWLFAGLAPSNRDNVNFSSSTSHNIYIYIYIG